MGLERQTLFLVFSVFVANMLTFTCSVAFAWTSPCLPRLNGKKEPENNPLNRNITPSEESLLVSLYFVGSLIGPFLSGLVGAKFGRKVAITSFTVPVTICFIMKAFGTNIVVLYIARFIGGLSGGCMYSVMPIYIAELSESHNRGALGAVFGIMAMLGNLYAYAVGSYTTIQWFSLSALIGPIVLFAVFPFFIPETPFYWIIKNKEDEAIKVLRKIRSKGEKEILDEIEHIKLSVNQRKSKGGMKDIWQSAAARKSLTITIIASALQQLSGIFAIQLYLQSIFEQASSSLSPENSTIIIGVVKVLSYGITILAVDRLGRRFLLMESSIGVFVSLVGLGTYFFLQDNGNEVSAVNWLPIVCLVIFMLAYNSGMGIVPAIYIGEFFPENLKTAAAIIVITFSSLLSFLVTFVFPYMEEALNLGPSFWVFSISSVFCAIFAFCVPETKGKTTAEIQKMLIS